MPFMMPVSKKKKKNNVHKYFDNVSCIVIKCQHYLNSDINCTLTN